MGIKIQKGFTVVELLAALALVSLVISIATGIYLNSTRQFHERISESDQFQGMYALHVRMEKILQKDLLKCSERKIEFSSPGDQKKWDGLLNKFNKVKDLSYKCWELDPVDIRLNSKSSSTHAAMVEFSGIYDGSAFMGSVIK